MQTFTDVLALRPATTFSTSTSTGGVVNIDNSASSRRGQVIYSNAGADAAGRLLNVRADNTQFPAAAVHVDYNGAGNAVEIVNSGTGSPSVALNVVSSNPNDTTLGIFGQELGPGTVKFTHTGTGDDANASALSLRLNGTGTAAQGIFLDATSGTTGKLLNLRNAGDSKIVATSDGKLLPTGGLGVGNSATGGSAITGAVVRKVEVFDSNGVVARVRPGLPLDGLSGGAAGVSAGVLLLALDRGLGDVLGVGLGGVRELRAAVGGGVGPVARCGVDAPVGRRLVGAGRAAEGGVAHARASSSISSGASDPPSSAGTIPSCAVPAHSPFSAASASPGVVPPRCSLGFSMSVSALLGSGSGVSAGLAYPVRGVGSRVSGPALVGVAFRAR